MMYIRIYIYVHDRFFEMNLLSLRFVRLPGAVVFLGAVFEAIERRVGGPEPQEVAERSVTVQRPGGSEIAMAMWISLVILKIDRSYNGSSKRDRLRDHLTDCL